MQSTDWQEKYKDRVVPATEAMKVIKSGDSIFIGTGCAEPQHLVDAFMDYSPRISEATILHLLTMGVAPYADKKYHDKFKVNSFFIGENVRDSLAEGVGNYTPMFLSEIPAEFESGRTPIDVALISISEPDSNGLCSLGVSVDIVRSAVTTAHYVIAQVNPQMPRVMGDSFVHVNAIDFLVPHEEPIIEIPTPAPNETTRRIARYVARLVEDGSTIEFGIGRIPQAVAEFLRDKKDLGIHTEMFSDWIIDLVESGAVTCARKNINRNKIVASFCMGTRRLYDYVDNNPFFEFHPSEYVNDPFVIAQHDKMVAVNVGLEIDLTGQVCADSLGYRFYSGIGGQVDFNRGAARSKGGKAIIALPATACDGAVSRIVSHLAEGSGVVTTRGDVHYVVTEYGIAYLHGKSIRERALALIHIAHPKFRKQLMHEAKAHNYLYEDQIELEWEEVAYPAELERYETLHDGTEIFFRPVKPTDEPALGEMLYSLSPDSVRQRFFTSTKAFPHRDVQQLTTIDYVQDLAIVGIVPGAAGEEEIVAIAQYFLDPKTSSAEAAFIVHDEWQDKGMGGFLLHYLAEIAKQRGVKRFHAQVLPANRPMLVVFQNSGYKVKTVFDGDAYSITLDLEEEEAVSR